MQATNGEAGSSTTPRLIDADDFLSLFYTASIGQDKEFIKTVEVVVEDTPTIDAEPVRHGRWIPKYVGAVVTKFQCSECPRTVEVANDYFGKPTKFASSKYPYCHCGTKMDLEEKNECES